VLINVKAKQGPIKTFWRSCLVNLIIGVKKMSDDPRDRDLESKMLEMKRIGTTIVSPMNMQKLSSNSEKIHL